MDKNEKQSKNSLQTTFPHPLGSLFFKHELTWGAEDQLKARFAEWNINDPSPSNVARLVQERVKERT